MAVEAGHNATIAVELGTPAVSGVFTVIPELMADLKGLSATRDWTQITPHGSTIDQGVSGPIMRNASSFTLNYNPDNATHTGLRAAFLAATKANRNRGWRFWGPSGAAGTDEVIQSGEITEWDDTAPEGAGVRQVAITVRFTGPAWIDAVQHGA